MRVDDLFSSDIPDPAQELPASPLRLPAWHRRSAEPAPDRLQLRRRKRSAVLLCGAWLAGHLAVFGVRHDLSQLGWMYVLAQVGLPFVLALTSLYVAMRPGHLGLGTNPLIVAGLAVLGPLLFSVIGVVTPLPHAAAHDAQPWSTALLCNDIMLAWMSAPLFAAAIALRRSLAATLVWRSALIGGSAGLISGATITLHCPNIQPFHLALGHAVPVVAGSLLGALVVQRWMRA